MKAAVFLTVLALAVALASCVSLRPYEEIRREVPAEEFVPVGGQLVHVEQRGEGEPVVLVHGFGGSTYSWRKVLPGLAAEYRVIALDLNGFGYTERPKARASYTREGQTALILGVLDALGVADAHFVGHSYGGALTLWIASRHPARVRSMILVDTAAPTYPDDRRSRLATLPLVDRLLLGLALRPGAVRRGLAHAYYDDGLATPEVAGAYLDRVRIEGVREAYQGLTAPSRAPAARIEFEDLQAPALLVWGEEDELVPIAGARAAAARLPHAELAALERTGHVPMEERPEEFLRLVLDFLARQRRGPPAAPVP